MAEGSPLATVVDGISYPSVSTMREDARNVQPSSISLSLPTPTGHISVQVVSNSDCLRLQSPVLSSHILPYHRIIHLPILETQP